MPQEPWVVGPRDFRTRLSASSEDGRFSGKCGSDDAFRVEAPSGFAIGHLSRTRNRTVAARFRHRSIFFSHRAIPADEPRKLSMNEGGTHFSFPPKNVGVDATQMNRRHSDPEIRSDRFAHTDIDSQTRRPPHYRFQPTDSPVGGPGTIRALWSATAPNSGKPTVSYKPAEFRDSFRMMRGHTVRGHE